MRAASARALGDLAAEGAAEALLARVEDADATVRAAAAAALSQVPPRAEREMTTHPVANSLLTWHRVVRAHAPWAPGAHEFERKSSYGPQTAPGLEYQKKRGVSVVLGVHQQCSTLDGVFREFSVPHTLLQRRMSGTCALGLPCHEK